MQKPDDKLIEKFLQSLCTKEEAEWVIAYLKSHPDHHYLMKEWEDTDAHTPLPENYTQQMFNVVDVCIEKPVKKTVKLGWKLAIAASLMGVIVSAWFLNKKNDQPATVMTAVAAHEAGWTTKYNTVQKEIVFTLADSSEVTMYPNASIRYRDDFNNHNQREIYMTEDVFFRVAKNKQKPFIVYSQNLSTTALGTAFRISAKEKSNRLTVELFEGKVLVALTDSVGRQKNKDYYLLPGQELVFNKGQREVLVRSLVKKNNLGKTKLKPLPQADAGVSYMFNNQTLADVLDQMSIIYNVKITYSKADVGSIYFIGKIEREDPVQKTINDIALLNHLTVTKQNGGYVLKKKH